MNFNEIPLPPPLFPSLISKKSKTNNDGHDLQQSKLKNMVIDELKSFFASRNQNNQQQYDSINSETNIQFQTPISTQKYPAQQRIKQVNSTSKKQIVQTKVGSEQTRTNKEQLNKVIISKTICNAERLLSIPLTFTTASTTLLTSISFLTSILLSSDLIHPSKKFSSLLNLLSDTLFYSTSFTFGCFCAQCVKQTKHFHIHRFGNILTRSLLLHTFLTLLASNKSLLQPQRTLATLSTRMKIILKNFLFTRQDIFLRLITSILHLIAGFTINFDDKNVII